MMVTPTFFNNKNSNNNNTIFGYSLLVFLFINLLNSCSGQSIFTRPGLVDQDDFGVSHLVMYEGLKMHIRTYDNPNITSGHTILFDAGLPFFSSSWGSVLLNLIPKMTDLNIKTVILYDRYGYGYSDLSPYGIDSFDFVRRLKASLNILDYQPPYILTGWSWGGINIQSYYVSYPEDVVGLYSVDGTDKEFYNDPVWINGMSGIVTSFKTYIKNNTENHQEFYKNCLEGRVPANHGFYVDSTNLPKIALTNNQNIFSDPSNKYLNAATQELGIMFQSSFKLLQIIDGLQKKEQFPFKNTPIVVLTASVNGQPWMDRQSAVAQLSTKSLHFIDTVSSHHIPTDNPVKVVNGLVELIKMIDTVEPLNSSSVSLAPNSLILILVAIFVFFI
ncbi:hypothetical protein CYY_004508 [Polysphondylium violaceum]|uniref:AB hydrolase-1 domain-containing protein n=1 Tax=Polysphondylium violaceum TaxID=133409 RepID=A0A8J4UZ73_9MYCE|nr:hypothetical protein CYY_004508 [Polysphondylium violaceum]